MTGKRASNAAAEAIRALIHDVQISDAGGQLLAVLPYPALKAKAVASGDAAKWRMSDESGALLQSGKIGEGLTLDRTDIQYGGTVTIEGIEIEIN
jgi:hypothetical protein